MNKQQLADLKHQAKSLLAQGNLEPAKNIVGALLKAKPKDPEVNWLVADVFEQEGHPIDAFKVLTNAVNASKGATTKAQFYERIVDLCGNHKIDAEGIEAARKWLALDSKNVKAHFFLGVFRNNKRLYVEAIEAFKQALKLDPKRAWTHIYLAGAYNHSGDKERSYEHYKIALELEPENLKFPTYFLYSTNGLTNIGEQDVVAEHLNYGAMLERVFPATQHQKPSERPAKLKIAYVGSEFRCHSVTYFLLPLLRGVDRSRYEIYCYSDTEKTDHYTKKIQDFCDHWRDVKGRPHEQVLAQVQRDNIDIMVDLNGYTGIFRMDVFASQAAPVQVAYLGYPNTTGLERMNYRITDAVADPEGQADEVHSETLYRLPGGFLCFEPDVDIPKTVPEAPVRKREGVCFGSFNAFHKLNESVVAAWSEILKRVDGSWILMKNGSLGDEAIKARVRGWFANNGIEADRVEMLNHTETKQAHFELYDQVDLHLDTFPYNGTTTTCEALWQGVPTLTYTGGSHRSRVSASILHRVGLDDFVAKDQSGYVDLAVEKVQDLNALHALRATLRERMAASPLMDEARFAAELSAAYERMFDNYLNEC